MDYRTICLPKRYTTFVRGMAKLQTIEHRSSTFRYSQLAQKTAFKIDSKRRYIAYTRAHASLSFAKYRPVEGGTL